MVLGWKVKVAARGQQVQKHIEGDGVAGVSLHSTSAYRFIGSNYIDMSVSHCTDLYTLSNCSFLSTNNNLK